MIRLLTETPRPGLSLRAHLIPAILPFLSILNPQVVWSQESVESNCQYDSFAGSIDCGTHAFYNIESASDLLEELYGHITADNIVGELDTIPNEDWTEVQFYVNLDNNIGQNSDSIITLDQRVTDLEQSVSEGDTSVTGIYEVLDPDLVEQLLLSGFFIVFISWFLGYAVSMMAQFFRRAQRA